ncbi:MAG: signal peptidase II [Nitrospirae bacterium]|nr:signal peptidase II [Nitrospirota bacterium]
MENKKPPKSYFLLIAIVSGVILIDQVTKSYIAKWLNLYDSIVVIRNFFSLTYTRNPGAAFGFLADQNGPLRTVFFLVISTVALAFLIYIFMKTPSADTLSIVALSLIMGGAVGNFLDRVRSGEVIDFLDFYIGRYHWWIFNFADSAITVGISILILSSFFKKSRENEFHFNL